MAKNLPLLLFVGVLLTSGTEAQICQTFMGAPGTVAYFPQSGTLSRSPNCQGIYRCYMIENDAPTAMALGGCNPSLASCSVEASVDLRFPGNKQNPSLPLYSFINFVWRESDGTDIGECGIPTGKIFDDFGKTTLTVGFSCADYEADPSIGQFSIRVRACRPPINGCLMARTITVDVAEAGGFCPDPPRPWSCNESNSCQAGCMGANGSGAAGSGLGGSSAAGGAPGLGGNIFGKAALFYQGGGIGAAGNPLPADWATLLGRYWSHEYAERIVPDPDDSHVWLLTKHATFREFTDGDMDGTYETASPSDEYRQLTKTMTGWELRELDGMVHAYDLNGRWLSSTDRNGNAKTATYDAMDRLERVDFPDGRHELFAYDGGGRLDTITEVGVDGTSTRVWDYGWTGDDLTSIDRPDGRSWALLYDDLDHPGFITRMTLIGDDGTSERIEGAWEYDSEGNVMATWRGDVDKTGPDAVDLWQFDFDDPALPVTTMVTDPLGTTSMHTFGRDDTSSKPRLEGVSDDCPTACGAGANSSTGYDPTNPLRPDSMTNGRGFVTQMDYDTFGQIASRTEASGQPEERTTEWQYDPTYPALVNRIERPSTTGNPLDLRVTAYTRDADGNITNEFREGVENGSAFSYETVRTYTPEGMLETLDGPDHGAADLVTFVYDTALRGGLILDERIDPLIGTTDYGYDAFNRRTSMVDVNGVVTTTEYDPANRVLEVRQKVGAVGSPDDPGDLVTENRYTTFGDLFQVVLPESNVIEYAYDAAGRLLTIERKPDDQPTSHGERVRYELNAYGQRILEVHERWEMGAWVEHARTAYEYATRCHLDKITAGAGAEESVTEYAYDCNNNLEKIWDANHDSMGQSATPSTSYAYDALDRLITVEQPFGDTASVVKTRYKYDIQDHLVEVTDGEETVSSYVYGDRDLMTKETSEVSGITDYTYTESGQLEAKTDARAIVETRSYDALDRVTVADYPDDSLDVGYLYDEPALDFGVGRLASITRAGHSVEYNYDRFGRITQDGELSLGYDQNGNRSTIGYAGGAMATYTFDYADREASLDFDDGGDVWSIVTSASYLPSGPLEGLTLGNGLEEIRPYDSRYYPDEIRVNNGMTDLLHWDYTVDAVGNPTTIADILDPANDRSYDYQDYQYFLIQGDGPWGTRTWTYDTIGNRLTGQKDGGFVDTYDYVPNAAIPDPGNSSKLAQVNVSGGIRTFTYDDTGNQTQVSAGGNIIERSYDDAGRMSRQERASADATTDFLYDGRGFLRSAVGREPVATGVSVFCDGFESGDTSAWGGAGSVCLEGEQTGPIYDSSGLLHAVDATRVLYFAGRPVAQFATAPLFLTADHLGTPIQATDGAMTVAWEGGFEPFGSDYAGAPAAEVFLRFPGQWEDETWEESSVGSEVSYNVMRWYSTGTGRYTRPDPLGVFGGSRNVFDYSLQNPLIYQDPTGLAVELWCSPIGAGGDSSLRQATGSVAGHCFVRVKCDTSCNSRGKPYDVRLEVTGRSGGFGNSRAEFPPEPRDFFVANSFATPVPISPGDWNSQDCSLEECLMNTYDFATQGGFPYPLPFGYVTGPNSNFFAASLLGFCGIESIHFPQGIPPFSFISPTSLEFDTR